MNELQIFKNEIFEVAVKLENNEVVFEADITARSLGFVQTKNGKPYVRWDRVNGYLAEIGFPHQVGKGDLIPESIVYLLAFKGETKTAIDFQKWLAIEVIPSIRKHGTYMTPDTLEKVLLNPDTIIKIATQLKEERQKLMEAERKIEEQKPQVLFAEAVKTSNSSILVGELAKILKQNGVEIGQKRLFKWLRDKGYLIKQRGEEFNNPTQRSIEQGLFEITKRTINNPDGSVRVTRTPKVTGKGSIYFVDKFLRSGVTK